MTLKLKKIFVPCAAALLVFGSLAACSKPGQSSDSSAASSQGAPIASSSQAASSSVDPSAVSSGLDSQSPSSQLSDAHKTLMQNMQKAAQQGKVINCDFAVKSNVIEDVQDKWGKEDKSEYIASAKGMYVTYSKHNAVFGYNKGSQLFEVRSFDSQLKDLSLSMVKAVLGNPAHDVKSGSEEIIGYVINDDYKILMVFPSATTSGGDAKMDHYSVFYPKGTVNSMADDPGREW